jgi:prepilin-type N-terminal cleavage/methylation domain-containing protein
MPVTAFTPFPDRARVQPGFTLVEMTIVLLIVSILLAGILMPLSIQMEVRRYADTKKAMDQINEALIGFVLINGRLPCPAIRTERTGIDATAGTERLTSNLCNSISGVIPWVTLNVPETDEWGRRFTYRVTSAFADLFAAATYGCVPSVNPTLSSFALCASGDLQVKSRTSTKVAFNMTNPALPAVFISHGKNGYGAYGPQGTLLLAVPAANVDETANANAASVIFISREKQDASSSCSDTAGTTPMCEFDDLVAWIPLTTLMNRMVVSGKLP